jgi:4-amino-4-deoxy-L-arabinose transferase-like glycosyltransferase
VTAALRSPGAAPVSARLWFWLLLGLAWFATVGWRPLMEPDEGRYAEIPREMWVSGDWVTPRLDAVKYFEKPVLQYWATAAVYAIFGVSEWSSRLWSCALAFLCIPLTYAFARHLHGSSEVAAGAAAVLALNPYFIIIGQINLLDSGLTFFLVASMFAFLRARAAAAGSSEERRWMLVTSLALALAVLTKGIVALVLAAGVLAIHMAVTREVRPLRRWHLALTLPLFLLVTAPWFIAVGLRNPEFPGFFFVHEHFARYLTNEADRVEPWWYFLPCVLVAVLPWIAQVAPSLRACWSTGTRDPGKSVAWFLLIWCAFVLAFFSVSHSKLATYIMPMMPALAVLLAPRIAERPAAVRQAAWIAFALILIVAIGLVAAAARGGRHVPTPMLVWSAIAVAIALVAAFVRARTWIPAALGSILAYQALMMSYSALPPLRTAKPLVAAIRPLVAPGTQLYSVDQYRQSVPPYLGRTLRLVRYRGELEFGLNQEQARFVPTLDAFIAEWTRARDALAFVEPGTVKELRARGVPFRVRASDARSVVVTRR